jgi:phosphatidylinositol dimannoside acyltransferase
VNPDTRNDTPGAGITGRGVSDGRRRQARGAKRRRFRPRRVARRGVFHLLRGIAWGTALISWRALGPLGAALGSLGGAWPGADRRRLRRDIATVLQVDAPTAARILRQGRRVNDRAVFEVLSLAAPGVDPGPLIQHCRIHETERLEPVVRAGRGAILLGMHMGNGVLMAARLAQLGFPVSVVYRESNKLAPGYLGQCLTRAGVEPIHLQRKAPAGGLRHALTSLRQGRLLYVLMDQGAHDGGVPVRFLGKEVPMPAAIVKLAQRAGAPVLAVLPEAAEPAWEFRVTAPLPLSADADAAVGEIARQMEAHIRRFPGLWAWHHRRWRRLPVLP